MPRLMSFSMTADRIRDRSKTVTRRIGWYFLRPGDILWACEKCQGLKRGEKVVRICKIQVTSVCPRLLCEMPEADCALEGYPDLTAAEFVKKISDALGVSAEKALMNRIEFKYLPPEEEQLELIKQEEISCH